MTPQQLFQQIQKKQSFLCVGLDTDLQKIPSWLLDFEDPVFEFNKRVIAATQEYAVAYKPNIAFYESLGPKGWESLQKTLELIPSEILTIADAKRGDIGNTSRMYARTFFETFDFDAVTIAPYMGEDSVTPFLEFENKWVFLLALTSNFGSQDFQHFSNGKQTLYQRVIDQSNKWADQHPGHLGYVVGATRAEYLASIRKQAPEAFFLVPGIGAQGGDLHAVCTAGKNDLGGLLINSSRGIIYAGEGENFEVKVGEAAGKLQGEMRAFAS